MAEEKSKAKHAHHGFKASHFEHHHDGSITVHHEHHDGPHKDVRHAVGNLDEAHDSMQENLGSSNPGEAEADAGQHGIPAPAAAAAGIPAPAATPGA